jgi:O-antigen/teichoic acid export membrane protein
MHAAAKPESFITRILRKMASSKLHRETAWAGTAKISALILFFLINVILARVLGVERYGRWNYLFSILTTAVLAGDFGITASARVWAARGQREGTLTGVITAAIHLKLGISLISASLFFLCGPLLAELVQRPDLAFPLRMGGVFLFCQGFCDFLKAFFEGLHSNRYVLIISLAEQLSRLALVVAFVYLAAGFTMLLLSFSAAAGVAGLLGIWLLYKKEFTGRGPHISARAFYGPIAQYAATLFLVSLMAFITLEISTLMLGYMTNDYEVGLYTPAKLIASKSLHLGGIVAIGTTPVFADMSSARVAYLRRLLRKVLLLLCGVYAVLVVAVLGLAEPIVRLLFGAEYLAGAATLRVMTLFMFALGVSSVLQFILNYRGEAARRARNLGISVILTVALNYVLIPRYGAFGAGVATALSFVPYAVLSYRDVLRSLRRAESEI